MEKVTEQAQLQHPRTVSLKTLFTNAPASDNAVVSLETLFANVHVPEFNINMTMRCKSWKHCAYHETSKCFDCLEILVNVLPVTINVLHIQKTK